MTNNPHMDSLRLENVCRNALNYDDRGALNGIVDAGYIDVVGNAYQVIAIALAPYFKNGNSETRSRIDNFLESHYSLSSDELDRADYSNQVQQAANELRELIRELE